jgi:chromosome segregation protein
VRSDNPRISAVLADWLGSVFTADSLDAALLRRTELPPGAVMVTAGGDLLSSTSLTFFAPDKSEHGLLERQREIETLGEGIAAYEEQAEAVREQLVMLDEQFADKQDEIGETRQYVTDRQQRVHAVQLEVLKLAQTIERYREQRERLQEQLAELAEEEESERERDMAADDKIAEVREGLGRIRVWSPGRNPGSTKPSAPCGPNASAMPISTAPCVRRSSRCANPKASCRPFLVSRPPPSAS